MPHPKPPLRIGTRRSLLARTQAGHVQSALAKLIDAERPAEQIAHLVLITTTGDRIQDRSLADIGGKALFTKEIEQALLDGHIDLAVHSMKDVAAGQPASLHIVAIPEREDVRDALICRHSIARLDDLPTGARIGAGGARRPAQLRHARSDLMVEPIRGNVDSRLKRLDAGEFDALVLAAAGLNRLGRSNEIAAHIDPGLAPPAPGQGALALQTRIDSPWNTLIAQLDHPSSRLGVTAERAALEILEASCRTAVGAWSRINAEGRLSLLVEGLSPDGRERWRVEDVTDPDIEAAHALGTRLGQALRQQARPSLDLGAG